MVKSKAPEKEEAFGAAPHERPVPRISIAAFVEFPDTGAALQRAGSDRRLAKAHVTVQLGGIQGAVDQFHGQVTPNLLIVETRLNGQEALDELDRLAEVCDPATKVIVVGRVNDVELYRELMRRGASEYLVAPLNPLQLIEVISGLYLDPDAAPIGRVVAFVGARGGVGFLDHRPQCGLVHRRGTAHQHDHRRPRPAVRHHGSGFQRRSRARASPTRCLRRNVWTTCCSTACWSSAASICRSSRRPASLDRDYDVPADAFEAVLDAVRQTTPCVIVDLPHVWTPWIKATPDCGRRHRDRRDARSGQPAQCQEYRRADPPGAPQRLAAASW